MRIVIGTYEGNLAGWQAVRPDASSASAAFQLSYAFHAHEGAVATAAIDGRGETLVTGGVDEAIRVFNLRTRKAVARLDEHTSTVSCAAFVGKPASDAAASHSASRATHLLTGDESGKLCIWRMTDWVPLDTVHMHKGGMVGVVPHASGRMALSAGADQQLALVDLTKGKAAHRMPLPRRPVGMTPCSSTTVCVLEDACVLVYGAEDGALIATLRMPRECSRLLCAAPLPCTALPASHMLIACGAERPADAAPDGAAGVGVRGDVLVWRVAAAGRRLELDPVLHLRGLHDTRIRCIAAHPRIDVAALPAPEAVDEGRVPTQVPARLAKAARELPTTSCLGPYLITADSAGVVKLWDADKLGAAALASGADARPVDAAALCAVTLMHAQGSRVTCLAVGMTRPVPADVEAAAGKRPAGAASSAPRARRAADEGEAARGTPAAASRQENVSVNDERRATGEAGRPEKRKKRRVQFVASE